MNKLDSDTGDHLLVASTNVPQDENLLKPEQQKCISSTQKNEDDTKREQSLTPSNTKRSSLAQNFPKEIEPLQINISKDYKRWGKKEDKILFHSIHQLEKQG